MAGKKQALMIPESIVPTEYSTIVENYFSKDNENKNVPEYKKKPKLKDVELQIEKMDKYSKGFATLTVASTKAIAVLLEIVEDSKIYSEEKYTQEMKDLAIANYPKMKDRIEKLDSRLGNSFDSTANWALIKFGYGKSYVSKLIDVSKTLIEDKVNYKSLFANNGNDYPISTLAEFLCLSKEGLKEIKGEIDFKTDRATIRGKVLTLREKGKGKKLGLRYGKTVSSMISINKDEYNRLQELQNLFDSLPDTIKSEIEKFKKENVPVATATVIATEVEG